MKEWLITWVLKRGLGCAAVFFLGFVGWNLAMRAAPPEKGGEVIAEEAIEEEGEKKPETKEERIARLVQTAVSKELKKLLNEEPKENPKDPPEKATDSTAVALKNRDTISAGINMMLRYSEASFVRDMRTMSLPVEKRRKAIENLGTYPAGRVARALWERLEWDPEPLIRQEAAKSLGRIGNEHYIAPLEKAVNSDQDVNVRGEAANAIRVIKQRLQTQGPSSVPPITTPPPRIIFPVPKTNPSPAESVGAPLPNFLPAGYPTRAR